MIKSKITRVLLNIILIIIALSFVVVGSGSEMWLKATQGNDWIVKVGSKVYKPEELIKSIEIAQRHEQLSADKDSASNTSQLIDRAINEFIDNSLLILEARAMGFEISDAILKQEIEKIPNFKDEQGKFDYNLLQSILKKNKINEEVFLEKIRDNLAKRQLLQHFFWSYNIIAPELLQDLTIATYGQKLFSIYKLNYKEITDGESIKNKVSKEKLEAFLQKNSNLFMEPEKRRFTYVLISPSMLNTPSVNEAEIKAAYQQAQVEDSGEEKRDIAQIILSSQAAAKEIYAELIAKPQNFMELAEKQQEKSKVKYNILLNDITYDGLDSEIADPMFNLELNAISQPVASSLGWHIFKVLQIKKNGKVKSYAEEKNDIKNRLLQEKSQAEFDKVMQSIEHEIAEQNTNSDLEYFAEKYKIPLHNLNIDARALQNSKNKAPLNNDADQVGNPQKIIYDPNFVTSVFNASLGKIEGPIQLSNSQFYAIIKVNNITPSTLPSLAEIREQVYTEWVKFEQIELAKAKILSARDKIIKNEQSPLIPSQLRLSYDKELDISFLGFSEPLLQEMYMMSLGQTSSVYQGFDDNFYFAHLDKIEYAKNDEISAYLLKFSDKIKNFHNEMLLSEYLSYLKHKYKVKTNQKLLNNILQHNLQEEEAK